LLPETCPILQILLRCHKSGPMRADNHLASAPISAHLPQRHGTRMNRAIAPEPVAQHAHTALQAQQTELASRIARLATGEGIVQTELASLRLARYSAPTPCLPCIYEPGLGIVVQGRKIIIAGDQTYQYDPLNYLVVSMTLPMQSQVVDATPDRPYLSLRLNIDLEQLASLILDLDAQAEAPAQAPACAAYVARVNAPLLDAVLRLMRLLDTPEDLRVLAPAAIREIHYRALLGDLGHRLRDLVVGDSRSHRIARAVQLLRQYYLEPLRIEALAEAVHMSVSSLHHQFKAATAMSPLQFQKQLRLHEARRLMLFEGLEAGAAAHRVGYESPSQFSREYKRLFGAPPRTEVGRMREAVASG
jgi:AraC-like DNA-binding protein